MSNLARAVELVEKAAEADAAVGRPPESSVAIYEAILRAYPKVDRAYAEQHPGLVAQDKPFHDDQEMVAPRYGLFYAAKMSFPDEVPDAVVRRWRDSPASL